MCEIVTTTLAALGMGGATAAGATATAATAAGTLQTIGAIAGIGGALYQGYASNQTAKLNARLIDNQRKTEQVLNATKEDRERGKFMSAIRQQFAELSSRGVALDSPTAITLGEYAGQEMSFNSQAMRSDAQARDTELSASAAMTHARGKMALLKGGFSAASKLLTGAPDLWPELLA